jgi:hypothetical protein
MSTTNVPFLPFAVECPHCRCMVIIEQINCAIFRHGIYKSTGVQMNPHESKELCDTTFLNKNID